MLLTIYAQIWKFSGRKFVIGVIAWVADLGQQGGMTLNVYLEKMVLILFPTVAFDKDENEIWLVFDHEDMLYFKFLFNAQVICNGWSP